MQELSQGVDRQKICLQREESANSKQLQRLGSGVCIIEVDVEDAEGIESKVGTGFLGIFPDHLAGLLFLVTCRHVLPDEASCDNAICTFEASGQPGHSLSPSPALGFAAPPFLDAWAPGRNVAEPLRSCACCACFAGSCFWAVPRLELKLGDVVLPHAASPKTSWVLALPQKLWRTMSYGPTVSELHQDLGQTSEALIAWEAAATLNPDSLAAWRGLVAAARQDVPLQLRALRRLALLEPGNAEWHAQLAATKLATTHASGDAEASKEVEADLDRALRLCPSNALALEQKALMMERAGKDAQALDFIEVAAKENRTSKEVLEAAATARWKRGHFPEAVIWYQELEHLDSENCLWPARLAQAALRQGQVAKAQAWLVSAGERLKRAEKAIDQPKPLVVAEVRSWLGYGHLLQDNAKAALETLQKVPSGLGSAFAFTFEALARRQQGEDTAAALRAAQEAEPRLAEVMYEMLPALPSRFMQHVEALLTQLKALPSEAGYPRTILDEYAKGRPVEVYSKSGGRWFPGEIVQAKDEMVKVRYLVDSKDPSAERQWCEKLLLRSSDSLRPAPPKGEAPAMKVPGPALSAAPAPKGIDMEAAMHRQTVQEVQRAPTPALASKKEVQEEPPKVMLKAEDLHVGKVLGSGGFGAVYRGTYHGQEVAIKKLHLIDGQVTEEQKREFQKEVTNLANLRHPRLVSLIGAAYAAPSLMIVTEFMPNGSLYEALHQRKLALELVKRFKIATQVSEGVSFLHSKQPPFVHRDLKSMNVIMDFELNAKLCDFGLTQSMEKTHISRRDNEGGSPRYMAPELFDSRGKITEKVDIWALGCLIVEVISSRLPHEECTSIQQVMRKTLVQKELPFTDWRGVSLDIQRLAELCFVFPPDGRTSAQHLLEGLNRLTRN